MPKLRRPAPDLSRRRWTIDDARTVLAGWRESGISLIAFARREGLDAHRLYRWRRRLAADGPVKETPVEFVELRRADVEGVEVVLRCGRVLRVSDTIDPSRLARLARALEEPARC